VRRIERVDGQHVSFLVPKDARRRQVKKENHWRGSEGFEVADVHLSLIVNHPSDFSDDELARATDRLRSEILQTDVRTVEGGLASEAPPGARAVDPVTLGTLIVTFAASGGVFTSLIGIVQTWLSRNDKQSVTLKAPDGSEVTITGKPSAEELQLIDALQKKILTSR
jgi:hypothetical protein